MTEKLKGIAYMRALIAAQTDQMAEIAQDIGISGSALSQFTTGADLPADKLDLLSRHHVFGWRKYDPVTDEMVSARDGQPVEKLPDTYMDHVPLKPMAVLEEEQIRLVTLREGKPPSGGVGSSAQDREGQRGTAWLPGMLRTG